MHKENVKNDVVNVTSTGWLITDVAMRRHHFATFILNGSKC